MTIIIGIHTLLTGITPISMRIELSLGIPLTTTDDSTGPLLLLLVGAVNQYEF